MPDIFDQIEAEESAKLSTAPVDVAERGPDIFDQVAAEQVEKQAPAQQKAVPRKADIFDAIEAVSTNGDIFDSIHKEQQASSKIDQVKEIHKSLLYGAVDAALGNGIRILEYPLVALG